VRYVVKGIRLLPKYGVAPEHKAPVDRSWALDIAGNRFRTEIKTEIFYEGPNKYHPRWWHVVFDGKTVREHNLDVSANHADYGEQQAEFYIEPETTSHCFESFDIPVFLAHGIKAAYGVKAVDAMKRPLHVEKYSLHDHGVVDGRDCVIVRADPTQAPPRINEFWVDAERDGAIVRFRQLRTATGAVTVEADIDYQKTPHGWYAGGWKTARYGSKGELLQANSVTVSEFEMNEPLDESVFKLEPRPGMYVNDAFAAKLRRVADDGNIVDFPPRRAKQEVGTVRREFILWGLAVFAVVAFAVAYKKRRASAL
jgi:hypothetical protein